MDGELLNKINKHGLCYKLLLSMKNDYTDESLSTD